jgi:hypothetical protein
MTEMRIVQILILALLVPLPLQADETIRAPIMELSLLAKVPEPLSTVELHLKKELKDGQERLRAFEISLGSKYLEVPNDYFSACESPDLETVSITYEEIPEVGLLVIFHVLCGPEKVLDPRPSLTLWFSTDRIVMRSTSTVAEGGDLKRHCESYHPMFDFLCPPGN